MTRSATPKQGRQGPVVVDEFEYELRNGGAKSLSVGMQRSDEGDKYDLISERYIPIRSKGRVWPLLDPVRFYGFPDEAVAYYENTGFLPDLTLSLEKQLGRVSYLGPLRETPHRTYNWSGEVPEHVGGTGGRSVEAILAASERQISRGYKARYRPFQAVIANWLSRLGLISDFQVKPIAKNRKEYEVNVQVTPWSPPVNLPDVGFGVSQVLPVITQCFYAAHGSTIILEQPEIHLHPKVQAGLADLFIEATRAREDNRDRSIQLLVESHSEHFLRRLQRLVAEEAILPSEIAVYFCSNERGSAQIEELEMDLFGRIRNWPRGFFGDLTEEVAEQTRNMLRRMREDSEEEANENAS